MTFYDNLSVPPHASLKHREIESQNNEITNKTLLIMKASE